MVKIAQSINAIMAGHTLGTKLLLMICHKNGVMLIVAIDARLGFEGLKVFGMARGASDGLIGIINLMEYKAETSCF